MNENFTMSPDEIVRDYLAAKAPLKQIRILADLNCCEKSEIVQILKDAGAPLPKNYYNGKNFQRKQGEQQEQPSASAPLTVGAVREFLAGLRDEIPLTCGGLAVAGLSFAEKLTAGGRTVALEVIL